MIGSLSGAAKSMNGVLHGDDRQFSGVSTDTRSLRDGELFFALQGPNFDGHDYVATAMQRGAAAAVVSRIVENVNVQIQVENTKRALGRLGATWRDSKNVRVVGITGSNGKTTLKELVAACLAAQAPTLATAGNLNNDIGMPLMLARLDDEHEFAVFEMGANHAGEIAHLVSLASPHVVAITNAGAAHLEGFGSIAGVAKAKGEILQNAKRPECAVLNADDDFYEYWTSLVQDVQVISFGFSERADVRASKIDTGANGSQFELHLANASLSIALPLAGVHNVRNACAAAAIASACGIDAEAIKTALETATPVAGRLQALTGINNSTLFDDSYNANPLSVIAAAEFLANLDGESWLVLGDMKELGADARDLHREVGASARACGIDRLFALGDLCKASADAFGKGANWYDNIDAMLADLASISAGTNVLVKGSRSMRMERVVEAMRAPGDVRMKA